MFCVQCGTSIDGTLSACGSCGRAVHPSLGGAELRRMATDASKDAWSAFKQLVRDPVGGLATSFASLGDERARAAGIAFGVVFAMLTALAWAIAAAKVRVPIGPKLVIGGFIVGLVPFAAIALAGAAARKAFRTPGGTPADLFMAGVALQPMALAFVLSAFLGINNFGIFLLLSLFAGTYSLCILFAGCTRLSQMPERFAPLTVAGMVLLSLWLSRIIATSFFQWDYPLNLIFS